MKQKKIGNKLYVFDLEAYVITADTDAQVIYVQNHVYDAFKALNPSLNIKRYNFNVMATNKPEWYDYIAQADEPIIDPVNPDPAPVVDKQTPEIYYNGEATQYVDNFPADIYLDSYVYNPSNVEWIVQQINDPMDYCNGHVFTKQSAGNVRLQCISIENEYYNGREFIIEFDVAQASQAEPTFVSQTYSFESFNAGDYTQKYAEGKVVTIPSDVQYYTKVRVIENTVPEFVGREFYIGSTAQPGDGQLWVLYIGQELTNSEISVKVYNEGMIPTPVVKVNPTISYTGPSTKSTQKSIYKSDLESYISNPDGVSYNFESISGAELDGKDPNYICNYTTGQPVTLTYRTVETAQYNSITFTISFTPQIPQQSSLSFTNNTQTITLTESLAYNAQSVKDDIINPDNLSPLVWDLKSGNSYATISDGMITPKSNLTEGQYQLQVMVTFEGNDTYAAVSAYKDIVLTIESQPNPGYPVSE